MANFIEFSRQKFSVVYELATKGPNVESFVSEKFAYGIPAIILLFLG